VERVAADPGEPGTESQQVGDIYASWMDVDTINSKGLDPIRGDLEKVAAIQAELYRQGVEVPYEFEIDPDRKDSSRYTVYFRQAGITMPNRDYYLDTDNENFAKAREELPRYAGRLLFRAGVPQGRGQGLRPGGGHRRSALGRRAQSRPRADPQPLSRRAFG
jgi:endothelin-converting enzyme/putative endopeptidase